LVNSSLRITPDIPMIKITQKGADDTTYHTELDIYLPQ
jgi:hypothetical protein